jgi:hypothetical protein
MDDRAGRITGFTKDNPEFVATIFVIEAATRGLKPRKKQKAFRRIEKRGQALRQQAAAIRFMTVKKQGSESARRDQVAMARAGECLLAALMLQGQPPD